MKKWLPNLSFSLLAVMNAENGKLVETLPIARCQCHRVRFRNSTGVKFQW
jgi:nitrite reductase/ring-hydroxylating ferredoxin subunit